MKTVTVIERRLTHYRVPLFEVLREQLQRQGLRMRLLHGIPTTAELKKRDEGHLPWAELLPTRYLLDGRICIQPFQRETRTDDLIIVNHENKLLCNLLALTVSRPRRIAFWGHGANMQSAHPDGLKERFKGWTTNRVDWWFAYTDMSVPLIERFGFPPERITVVNNSVDTTELGDMWRGTPPQRLEALRREFGLAGTDVGIFIGSLYEEKRIHFMLEAASVIKARLPTFEFVIVGAGPESGTVDRFCTQNSWAKYLGVRKGQDKAEVLALAKVMINPGLVGLGILDSFACAVPMLTTDCGLHSPEICYLEHGGNGMMTPNTLEAYAETVCNVLTNDELLQELRRGCTSSAANYTIQNMAAHFVTGTLGCLAAQPYVKGNRLK
ncbi:glycosyltransferase family 4 protein [Methylibium sp.]|uniref:glycosyltransferase family 4 protein n=1 Tax=Methylibium sp. TaxID=2067992 RepID=UPI003D0B152F